MSSDYTPGEEQLIQHYRELSETVSGEATVGKQNTEVARRTIAKIKADARNETIDLISRHYEDYLPAEWSWKVEKELRGKHELG